MEQDPSSLPVGGGGSLELWRPTGLVCLSEGPWHPWQDPGPFVSGGRAPAWGFPRGAVPCSPTPVSWLHSAVVGGSTERTRQTAPQRDLPCTARLSGDVL